MRGAISVFALCSFALPALAQVNWSASSPALVNLPRMQFGTEVTAKNYRFTRQWFNFLPHSQTQHSPSGVRQASSQAAAQDAKDAQHRRHTNTGSPGHIFWVIPAHKVEYGKEFKPLTTQEKFHEWAESEYDPLGLGAGGLEAATLEHSSRDGFCGYGSGWAGYGKCFGSLQLDAADSSFIGDYALTVLFHQDPRYFRLGHGSFGHRVLYSVERVFITYNDSGQSVFYSSALMGTVAGAAISNLYYPSQDVGVGHTMSRIAIDLGNTALYNAAAEFWPDVHKELKNIF